MAHDTFEYRPLDPDSNRIRLVRLHAGIVSDNLRCDIMHCDLTSPQAYEALSYAWGDSTPTHTLHINDHRLPITTNLASALRGLRMPDKERVLWIDAICINQFDIPERNHQVGQMRQVYEKAVTTLVWLGERADNSHDAFNFVRELAQVVAISKDDAEVLHRGLQNVFDISRVKHWDALDDLMNQAWWARAWVIQEVAVSSRVIVVCGNDTLEWGAFTPALSVPRSFTEEGEQFWIKTHRTHAQLMKYTLIGSFPDVDDADIDLRGLIVQTRSKFASDPRDKVFALLGLATDSHNESRVPDYSKTVELVYKETMKDIIARDSSLAILEYAGVSRSRLKLPSWCVDWTYGEGDDSCSPVPIRTLSWLTRTFGLGPTNSSIELYGHDVSASGPAEPYAVFDETLSMLQIRGLAMGRISALGIVASGGNYYEAMTESSSSSLGEKCKNPYPTGEEQEVAIDQARHGGFWRDSRGDQAERSRMHSILTSAWEDRRFAVTDNGYVGLVPSDSEIGDTIWVVAGCEVPLVMRASGGSCYVLIGQCYSEFVCEI